jgi:hypothetical protein
VTSSMKAVIYPVKDLGAAKTLYGKLLGVPRYVDEPYYVGFSGAGRDVGSVDPNGHRKGHDMACRLQARRRHRSEPQPAPRSRPPHTHEAIADIGCGKLVASVKDADGKRHRTRPGA